MTDSIALTQEGFAQVALEICLRPFEKTDNEAHVEELLDKWISRYLEPAFSCWAIALQSTGEWIDQLACFLIDDNNHFGEIEYCIGEAFQNKGLKQ